MASYVDVINIDMIRVGAAISVVGAATDVPVTVVLCLRLSTLAAL